MSFRSLSLIRGALLCAAAVPIALLSGCAMTPSEPAGTTIASIGGVVHGGQSPIQAATVTLYVTSAAATNYGQAATVIGTSLTDVNGAFTISPSATTANCPSGQFAYLTSAGGYPSGAPTLINTSTLMMTALGNCSSINSGTFVFINEVTTVAAGYALSAFMTTSVSGSLYVANVSAPAANRGLTGTTAVAAGLAHAFLNAATLASYGTGTANSQTGNIVMGGITVNGSVPLAEINALGDILQSCVNGVTANSSCNNLFSFTPTISGNIPNNTLQAMINLARNPYPTTAAMNTTGGLFSLISSSPAFQPALAAVPPDWSLAIVYNGSAFPPLYDIALDANDTVYAGRSATAANLLALSAYGVTTPAYTAAATGTATRQIAPDSLGNVWMTNNANLLLQYSASGGGAPATYNISSGASPEGFGVAVDKANNVWVANAATVTPNIEEFQYTAGSPATYAINYTATAPGGFQPVEITIDANQNIWSADYYTNGSLASVLANLSAATPAATPTYAAPTVTTITPISATFLSSAIKPLGVVIDAGGNAWYGITGTTVASNTTTTTGIEEVVPVVSSSVITSLNPQSLIANATLGAQASQIPAIDGAETIYIPDNFGGGALGIHVYSTVSVASSNTGSQVLSPPSGYLGCYLATATTTTCGTLTASAVYNPREVAVDSTGSVWADISTTGGLTQLIGLAAPAWPLLQTGKPGLSPGLTAAKPLP